MPKHRLSLRSLLVVQVLLPLLATLLLFTVLGLRALEGGLEKGLQEDVELVARAVRLPIGDSLERGSDDDVRQALESVFRIGRVYGAYVYGAEGDLVAAVGAVNPSARADEVARMAADGERQGAFEEIGGREVYSYFLPLSDSGGRINGLLQVTRRASDFETLVSSLRWQAGIVIALSAAVVSVLVLVGHRSAIGRHIEKLIGSMARVEDGDRAHRAVTDGPREIMRLSSALNTMLDAVDQAESEVVQRRDAQRLLEDQLRQAEKLAAIGRLAAGVAHELGTPLSVIDGKAQRGLRHAQSDSPEEVTLRQIRAEVSRMEHIVRQLLEFGRSRNRNLREIRLGSVVAAASAALEPFMVSAGAELEQRGPSPDPVLQADPVQMEQVLVNLLRNALQAGARRLLVDWRLVDAHRVALRVEDDGAGIKDADRFRVFEPFFTTKAVGEGTGLGLAVVHGIVQEHEGDIRLADSRLGGTAFVITLPREPANTHDGEAHEQHG